MGPGDPTLAVLARRYVWWKPVEESVASPGHLLCQLMQLGTEEDITAARRIVGDDAFRRAHPSIPACR